MRKSTRSAMGALRNGDLASRAARRGSTACTRFSRAVERPLASPLCIDLRMLISLASSSSSVRVTFVR